MVTIIPGTVALCLKDNRGNSIKWPWMVHSCRSTLFLTGLTDQSAPGREARAPTHRGFLSPLRHGTEFLFDRGRAQRRNRDAKVNYLAYIRMPPRVRIDLLFSSESRTALVCPGIERIENGIPSASYGTRIQRRDIRVEQSK